MFLKMGTITANFIKPRALINLLLQISSEGGRVITRAAAAAGGSLAPAPHLALPCPARHSARLRGHWQSRGALPAARPRSEGERLSVRAPLGRREPPALPRARASAQLCPSGLP